MNEEVKKWAQEQIAETRPLLSPETQQLAERMQRLATALSDSERSVQEAAVEMDEIQESFDRLTPALAYVAKLEYEIGRA